ncbi:MAG: hypothetical protein IKQ46_13905 [Bacteroidales bacterium]|nr:hypothetical protein [Bacteroidales bacterium]
MAKTGQNIEAVVFFHPGEFLGEKMDEMGISEKDFSKLSGISEEKVHLINKCKADVDFDTATALEKATLIPTHFWLKLQDDYNIYRIRLLAESLTNSIKRPAENDVKRQKKRKTVNKMVKLTEKM